MGKLSLLPTTLHSNKPINKISNNVIFQNTGIAPYLSGIEKLFNNKYNLQDIKTMPRDKRNSNARIGLKKGSLVNNDGKNIIYDDEQNMTNLTLMNKLRLAHLNNDGTWNKKAIAGSGLVGYTGLSSAYRLASGGSLYKDDNGNTNLIGIPFI